MEEKKKLLKLQYWLTKFKVNAIFIIHSFHKYLLSKQVSMSVSIADVTNTIVNKTDQILTPWSLNSWEMQKNSSRTKYFK